MLLAVVADNVAGQAVLCIMVNASTVVADDLLESRLLWFSGLLARLGFVGAVSCNVALRKSASTRDPTAFRIRYILLAIEALLFLFDVGSGRCRTGTVGNEMAS